MYKQHKKMMYQAYILISMQMNNWFNYRNYLDTDGQAAIQRKGEQIAMYIWSCRHLTGRKHLIESFISKQILNKHFHLYWVTLAKN